MLRGLIWLAISLSRLPSLDVLLRLDYLSFIISGGVIPLVLRLLLLLLLLLLGLLSSLRPPFPTPVAPPPPQSFLFDHFTVNPQKEYLKNPSITDPTKSS